MKVYLATSGEYSDYRVQAVFRNREDADSYALGEQVEEYELHEGPIEVRYWHTFCWDADRPDHERDGLTLGNPWSGYAERRDFDGDPRHVEHRWDRPPYRTGLTLTIQGWDPDLIRTVYSEQRARYLARQQGVS